MALNAKKENRLQALMKGERILTKVERIICAIWFLILILMMVMQVLTRFVLKNPLPWTDEAGRYLWATLCFIGCGAAITDNAHIEINIIGSLIGKMTDVEKKLKLAKVVDIIRFFVVLGMAGLLTYLIGKYMILMYGTGQVSAAIGLPVWILYGLYLAGCISVIIHCICRIIISFLDHDRILDPLVAGGDVAC